MAEDIIVYPVGEDTGRGMLAELGRISAALEAGRTEPELNEQTGRYEHVGAYLRANLDRRIFTTRIAKWETSHSPACTKMDDNAGLIVEPSTNTYAGRDDYRNIQAFEVFEVNGGADSDGKPWASHWSGRDAGFSRHGTGGNVYMMSRILWYRWWEDEDYYYVSISAYPHAGFKAQPGAGLPDGSLREFILYAKYALGKHNGLAASVSGLANWNRNISHNTMLTYARQVGEAYSGKTTCEDWYLKVMVLIKYATKSVQSVYAGCTSYYLDYQPTVAESDTTRVIIAKASAANLVVGSSVSLGTSRSSNSVLDSTRILSIEDYDNANSAVYLDVVSTFNTSTDLHLSTMPWHSGACDGVLGLDGTRTEAGRTNGKEPCVIQGIEIMTGSYEVMSDSVCKYDAEGAHIMRVYDTTLASTSAPTSDYVDTGAKLFQGATDAWHYAEDYEEHDGMLVPAGGSASATTGVGDAQYTKANTYVGVIELLSVGGLVYGGADGLGCLSVIDGLSGGYWIISGRLSPNGRQRGVNSLAA